MGYSDLNDHDDLRKDIAFQTALNKDTALGSSPTLSRLENRADRETAITMHKVILENFIKSYKRTPKKLILDFDATDDIVHGNQEGRFFHGYYNHYCFLPLYVFCGDQLLVSYLRPSKIDGAKHTWAILSLLVKRLRDAWPKVKIIFRGDSGFCRWRMLRWCEKNDVLYIVGLAKNAVLKRMSENLIQEAFQLYEANKEKVRLFSELQYSARTWNKERRVIIKSEYNNLGPNLRFVITNMEGDPQDLYDSVYVARGNMENRIKEQQLDLFADRTSCHKWWANQFHLLLSSLAYVLLESLRSMGLKGTKYVKVQCNTLRLKFLKIGAVVIKNTRKVYFKFSSSYPYQNIFQKVVYNFRSD